MAQQCRCSSLAVILLATLFFAAAALAQEVRFDSVTPNTVRAKGGDLIEIHGQYFRTPYCFFPACPGPRLTIDGVDAGILVFSDTVLRVVTPPHPPGTANIVFYPEFQPAAAFPNAISYVADIPVLSRSMLAVLAALMFLLGLITIRP